MTAESQLEPWQEFLLQADRRFHETLLVSRNEFPGLASDELLNISNRVRQIEPNELESAIWNIGGVAGEIRELFNRVNQWGLCVFRFGIWIKVYRELQQAPEASTEEGAMQLWELRDFAINPLAHFCLLQPSGLKWRLATTAEHALHIANRAVVPGYPDALTEDEPSSGHWRRMRDILDQLKRLGTARCWRSYDAFRDRLGQIDSGKYRRDSRKFRDLAAHGFAPHFEVGIVDILSRKRVPWRTLKPNEDGSSTPVEEPEQQAVSYGFGGMEPLPYDDAFAANSEQYTASLDAMSAFQTLVEELTTAMNSRVPARNGTNSRL